jgi:hypothetical protein
MAAELIYDCFLPTEAVARGFRLGSLIDGEDTYCYCLYRHEGREDSPRVYYSWPSDYTPSQAEVFEVAGRVCAS